MGDGVKRGNERKGGLEERKKEEESEEKEGKEKKEEFEEMEKWEEERGKGTIG